MDESVFSTAQSQARIWALPGPQPPAIERNKVAFEAIAAVGVIDAAGNVVACEARQKSYDSASYLKFLKKFKRAAITPCELVVDNASFHRSAEVLDYCRRVGITVIFNGIYSSQYMPIERLWLFAKLFWRKEVLQVSDFKNKLQLRRRIEKCINQAPQ